MNFFSSKKFYNKLIYCFVSIVFLLESMSLPVIMLLPRVASATVTPTISLSPASSYQGSVFTMNVIGDPNRDVVVYLQNPNGTYRMGGGFATTVGQTDATGVWQQTYYTDNTWAPGTYTAWATVNSDQTITSSKVTMQILGNPSSPSLVITPTSAVSGDSVTVHLAGMPSDIEWVGGIPFFPTAFLTLSRPDSSVIFNQLAIGKIGSVGTADYQIVTNTSWPNGMYHVQVDVIRVSTVVASASGSFALGGTTTQVQLTSLSPSSGPIHTTVSVSGTGFTASGNTVMFGTGALPNVVSSSNGTTMQFAVPDFLTPLCRFSTPACGAASTQVVPGQYPVSITNANGTSNTAQFMVTAITSATTSTSSISIFRTLMPTASAPFHAGDNAGIFTMDISASLFLDTNTVIFHNLTSGVDQQSSYSVPSLKSNNVCDTSGHCIVTGTWTASQLTCADPSTPVKQTSEWVTIGSSSSNTLSWYFQCSNTTPSGPAPTPETAPMDVLRLNSDQDIVFPTGALCGDLPQWREFGTCTQHPPVGAGSLYSFSATLNSDLVSFPQDSLFWITLPSQAQLIDIVLDGRSLVSGTDYVLDRGHYKFSMQGLGLLSGTHSIRVALQSPAVTLDYLGVLKMNITDGGLTKIFIRERTASVTVRHPVTEMIGKTITFRSSSGYTYSYPNQVPELKEDVDVHRLEVYPAYPDVCTNAMITTCHPDPRSSLQVYPLTTLVPTLAYTLLGDTVPIYVNQFSDSLSREFIIANYNFLLGRNPTGAQDTNPAPDTEMGKYLSLFTNWRDPFAALNEVYHRRTDLQTAYPTGLIGCTSVNIYNDDSLCKWARVHGWQEEPTLQAFKENVSQAGIDVLRNLADTIMSQWATAVRNAPTNCGFAVCPPPPKEPLPCNFNLSGGDQYFSGPGDWFDACRTTVVLWAKDKGWADPTYGSQLAPYFAPGAYPEYQADRAVRYPPATLYYEIVSSPEYLQSIQSRFKKNIDSLYRVTLARPANDSDIDAWYQFMKNQTVRWTETTPGCVAVMSTICTRDVSRIGLIRDNWEPQSYALSGSTGALFDATYGIRNIVGEIDSLSGALVDRIANLPEMTSGNNLKRAITGLFRLYLRRSPSLDEVNYWQNRISTDNAKYHLQVSRGSFFCHSSYQDFYGLEGIEMELNQSGEYGADIASSGATNNVWRTYINVDPGVSWGTLSNEIAGVSQAVETAGYAEKHPELGFVFPVKKFVPQSCGGFGKFFVALWGSLVFALAGGFAFAAGTAALAGVAGSTVAGVGGATLGASIPVGITAGTIGGAIGSAALSMVNGIGHYILASMLSGADVNLGLSVGTKALAGLSYGKYNFFDFLLWEAADPDVLRALNQPIAYTEFNAPVFAVASPFFGEVSVGPFASILGSISAFLENKGTGPILAAGTAPSSILYKYQEQATSTPAFATPRFTKFLGLGSSGNEVKEVQKMLIQFFPSFLQKYQTGYFGLKTVAAVKKLQKQYGITQTGLVGPKTRAILNKYAR